MSIIRRLEREVRGNPTKAAGLGVLLLIAGYFWAPLIAQLFGSGGPATPAPANVAAAPQPPAQAIIVPSLQKAAGGEVLAYDWQRYAKLIDDDSRMDGSAPLPEGSDPFREDQPIVEAETSLAAEAVEESEPEEAPITPAEAGLVLGTTLVSTNKKVAEINGRSYGINDQVKTAKGDLDANFRVLEIYPRRVVLERLGKRFELKIPRPLVDGAETLTGNVEEFDDGLSPSGGNPHGASSGNREGN
jgi:hypothetical protein